MPVDNDHGADNAQQHRFPRPDRFFDSENLKRHNYTRDSFSLSPCTDIPDSSESIFNAVRVTSPEESRCSGPGYNTGPIFEERLAANVAMFIPSASSNDGPSAELRSPRNGRGQIDTVWWRNQMLSDQSSPHTHLGAGPFTETILAADAARDLHPKAISLDTVEGNQHIPRWPENVFAAVSTVRPQYPPPERWPTPPGLPSFNTPEAVYCSAQFLVGQNGGRRIPGDGQQPHSYGEALLRFLGLSPSNGPGPGGLSVVGIGRAEDGTIVQGRFPYRQSGHGTNLARHPFHQSNLPIAENETEQLRYGTGIEGTSNKNPVSHSRKRVRIYTPPSLGRLWPFSDATSNPAISPRPRKQGRAIPLLGLQRTSPTRDGPTAAASSTVESSAQGVTLTENQIPLDSLDSSQLQPAPSAAVPDDVADEELPEAGHWISNFLSWIPAQLHLCCSGRCTSKNRNSMEPLEVVTTGETYLTAREDQHRMQWKCPLWISSLPSFSWPGALSARQPAC